MVWLFACAAFACGAVIASFVVVVTVRFGTGERILSGRSKCDACGRILAPSALIPVVSFVLHGGRARCCGAKVPFFSTAAELLLGGLFALSYLTFGFSLDLIVLWAAFATLMVLVGYDLMHQILPPALLSVFTLLAALHAFLAVPNELAFAALYALMFGVLFLAIHFISGGRALGFSDAPLVFALALLAGARSLAGLVFSFWIGAVVGIAVLFGRAPRTRMTTEVPFAPFLAAGFLLALFTQWDPFALITQALMRMIGA